MKVFTRIHSHGLLGKASTTAISEYDEDDPIDTKMRAISDGKVVLEIHLSFSELTRNPHEICTIPSNLWTKFGFRYHS